MASNDRGPAPLRVACFVTEFPALSETFILDQITGLIDRGAEVDIFAAQARNDSKVHRDVERYHLMERVSYSRPRPNGALAGRVQATGIAGRAVLRSPTLVGKWVRHRLRRREPHDRRAPLEYLPITGFRKRSYDMIHCHFGMEGRNAEALRDAGIIDGPIATAFHAHDISSYLRVIGDAGYRRLFERGDLFLPISEYWRRRLLEMGADPNKTVVHHMGVDPERFQFRPRRPAEGEPLRIVTVGRLVEKKGIEYALRAVAALRETHPNLSYRVVGDGALRGRLTQLIDELELRDVATILGWCDRERVADEIGRAHLMLAPSVPDSDGEVEGIPMVLMEAMASGVPVVTSDHTGIPELVEDGVTGHLAPERDVDALVHRLRRVADDADEAARIAAAARAKIEADFNVKRLNARLFELFRSTP